MKPFRAWNEKEKKYEYFVIGQSFDDRREEYHLHCRNGSKFDFPIGAVDNEDVEIWEDDLLRVRYTSSEGEYIHDCIYRVAPLGLEGIQLQFVKLTYDDGINQYPINQELSFRYDTLLCRYYDGKSILEVNKTYGENRISRRWWAQTDHSTLITVIGTVRENPELMK